jgi:hypothetical protein
MFHVLASSVSLLLNHVQHVCHKNEPCYNNFCAMMLGGCTTVPDSLNLGVISYLINYQ